MKSRNITTIIAEGTDGVGKSALIDSLFKIYDYRYMVYHRGELSNLFYAQKYGRPFSATQVGLPFLHILLTCDKKVLRERIIKRGEELHQSKKEVDAELKKINDQDEFIRLFNIMKKDYHMLMIDTTNLSIEEVGKKAAKMIDEYVSRLQNDDDISEWNEQYLKACSQLGLNFTVKDNQPYINDIQFMAESTLHNGVFETFSDKSYPDNLIYAYAYGPMIDVCLIKKQLDFAYIIYSKVKRRHEVYDYLAKFMANNKSCLIADNEYMPEYKTFVRIPRVFGKDFINEIAHARATVYCGRDLASLKLQTARLYEAILANQIVFVDKESDPDCEILNSIYKDNPNKEALINLLYVTPETICSKYDRIMSVRLDENIVSIQREWYNNLIDSLIKSKGGKFNDAQHL